MAYSVASFQTVLYPYTYSMTHNRNWTKKGSKRTYFNQQILHFTVISITGESKKRINP